MIKISLEVADQKQPDYALFKPEPRLIANFLFSSIIFGLIIGVGFVLFVLPVVILSSRPIMGIGLLIFIIPAVIVALKLQFHSYFVVDKRSGPIQALKQSWKVTGEMKINLLLLWLCVTVINTLGVLALFIGLFWTIPTTQIATAYLYNRLFSSGRH